MKVLSTRRTADGRKRRRYESPGGARFTTIEIPLPLFNRLVKAAPRASAEWTAAEEKRQRRERARALWKTGAKAVVVAQELGVHDDTAYRWFSEFRRESR